MANGGIIGPVNIISTGGNTVTTKTSSGDITLQPGTRLVQTLIVSGGGAGGAGGGGGGGAGGLRNIEINAQGTATATIGAGGAAPPANSNAGGSGIDSSIVICAH